MPQFAALYFAGSQWRWPVALAGIAALVFVGWSYYRTAAPPGLRLAGAALKLLGIFSLLACLLEPMWSGQRARPGANIVAVIADNSLSMTLHDRDAKEARGDALRRALTGERNLWHTRLGANFTVRDYIADSRLQPSQNFRDLTFDGQTTALGHTLEQLAERHRGQPLAAVLLMTDGIAADLDDPGKLRALPPVYPVLFGSETPLRDIAITNVSVTQTSFEDAPVTITAEASAAGFAGEDVVARLVAIETGKGTSAPVPPQTMRVPRTEEKLAFRFQIRPVKTGVLFSG